MINRNGRVRWLGAAGALTLAAACAFNTPPGDEKQPDGGLPEGVSASPATPQTGPETSPTPVGADQSPLSTRLPIANFAENRAPLVREDSATRLFGARLDSVIIYGNRDITAMPIPAARALVKSISAMLHPSRVPRVHNVAVELDSLDMLLGQSPLDGKAVGRSLKRLSGRAAAASPEAGVLAGRVVHLADVLEKAGNRLASGQ